MRKKWKYKCEQEGLIMKQDLNGHYCIATKEHYDKLVEYGYEFIVCVSDYTYLELLEEHTEGKTKVCMVAIVEDDSIPMHLYNGQWVFGSLEHKSENADEFLEWLREYNNPKPPKRITREEALQRIKDCRITSLGKLPHGYVIYESVAIQLINELLAKQKDK